VTESRCVHIAVKNAGDGGICMAYSVHIPLEAIHSTPRVYVEFWTHDHTNPEAITDGTETKPTFHYKSPILEIDAS